MRILTLCIMGGPKNFFFLFKPIGKRSFYLKLKPTRDQFRKLFVVFGTALILMAAWSAAAFADDTVNENDLFSNPNSVVDSKPYDKKDVDADQNKKHVGISGEITSALPYSGTRGSVKNHNLDGNVFDPYIDGVLFLDARLPQSVKGFGNFETTYNPDSTDKKTQFYVRELFLDFNIAGKVYFRTGKQVLQWGRCYLWNPTDLINVEKKTFVEKVTQREGTYGLKMHIPFGTFANIYGFADTSNADNINKVAGAGKLEFLFGTTEMAFSTWGKEGYHPVYGYDFSTRIATIDIVGEASASYGSNTQKVVVKNGTLTSSREKGKWIPKASINFGRAFDVGDQIQKIQINTEFFYNGDGYRKNILDDGTSYLFDSNVTLINNGQSLSIPGGNKAYYLFGKGLYEPNYYSRYYAALFTTINKFFIDELALTLNCIGNLSQKSFIVATGLAYSNINDFKMGITVNSYLGRKNTEYTYFPMSSRAYSVLLTAGIVF